MLRRRRPPGSDLRRARSERPADDAAPVTRGRADLLLDFLPAGVFLLDDDDIVVANRAGRESGVTHGGRLTHPALLDAVRTTAVDGEPQVREVTVREGMRRNARHLQARTVRAPEGLVALVLDDVTDAKRVEAMRRDFVANVSHEIKTPVGAIMLLVEALQEAADDPAATRQFVGRLGTEAARLSRLVQELLDLSRLQADDVTSRSQPVAVDDVVREAVCTVRNLADERRITVVQGVRTKQLVRGDRSQLVTALRNLLDNAISYSPEGTRVTVSERLTDAVVEIAVTDQGVGIPAEDLERIFERFYRVDPARSRATGGTGLGLAIVKHIAANHHGEVTVWSEPGTGSTFTLRLPALDADPDGDTPDTEQPEESP